MCENYVILIKTILGGAAMRFEDEKDYIMRMIKEMVSVLFSILLGKQYVSVDEERKNGYEVSIMDRSMKRRISC